ncbi:fimbrial protein [Lelliottia sp. WAP21]|uniref:fimbrial protein n=1 Tax=Lelliottia sp. WAP21 TaxID=2877426 RepID=UPI001E3E24DC|nr:fimbrial protein [Lelliottia sp. WAP21]
MRRIFTALLILLGAALMANQAYAAHCTLNGPLATLTIPDSITLNPAKQGVVGTVLWSKTYRVPDVKYTCDASTQSTWHSFFTRNYIISSSENIFNTEIPGIGIRMRWPTDGSASWIPGNSGAAISCTAGCSIKNSTVLVEFVQIAPVSEGESFIPAGPVAAASVVPTADASEQLPILAINFGATIRVLTRSCSIYPSTVHVDLGTYSIADFQNNDSKQGDKKEFTITIACPVASTGTLTFTPLTQAPFGSLTGVIGTESGEGYARNFLIRLYEKTSYSNPLKLETAIAFSAAPTLTKTYQAEIFVPGNVNRQTDLTPGQISSAIQYTMVLK